MTEVPYPYATGDLLAERNEYNYTAYQGAPFLQAWQDSRDKARSSLPPPAAPPPGDASAPIEWAGSTPSGPILEALLGRLEAGGLATGEAAALDGLVKKFEVTKRVHDAYGADMRAVDPGAHRTLSLSVRLAEVFERAYATLGGLPYLNVLLKTMDTLVALASDLSAGEGARLAWLIARERGHVGALANRRGVEW